MDIDPQRMRSVARRLSDLAVKQRALAKANDATAAELEAIVRDWEQAQLPEVPRLL